MYIISDLRGPLYVGRTENLRRRYINHYDRTHNPWLEHALRTPAGRPFFAWIHVSRHDLTRRERDLIRALQPLCNNHPKDSF